MNPFVFFVSLVAVVLLLTTCTRSEACPLMAETRPATIAIPINGTGQPYYGPDSSLFPQTVPGAIAGDQNGITLPLPTGSGFLQFLQLIGTVFMALLLRSQNRMMAPPG